MTNKIRFPEEVLMREVGNDTLLLNTNTHQYFTLNATGVKILEMLMDSASIGKIVEGICAEFDASKEQIEDDVEELIEELKSHRLIEVA